MWPHWMRWMDAAHFGQFKYEAAKQYLKGKQNSMQSEEQNRTLKQMDGQKKRKQGEGWNSCTGENIHCQAMKRQNTPN